MSNLSRVSFAFCGSAFVIAMIALEQLLVTQYQLGEQKIGVFIVYAVFFLLATAATAFVCAYVGYWMASVPSSLSMTFIPGGSYVFGAVITAILTGGVWYFKLGMDIGFAQALIGAFMYGAGALDELNSQKRKTI